MLAWLRKQFGILRFSRDGLVEGIWEGIAQMEGWYMTKEQATRRGIVWPTVAQRNGNPGNLRSWPGRPVRDGYALFVKLTGDKEVVDVVAGSAALRAQIRLNIWGGTNYPRRKTHPMSLREFFAGQRDENGDVLPGGYPGFAPARDKNQPVPYAVFVGKHLGIPIDVPLKSLVKEA